MFFKKRKEKAVMSADAFGSNGGEEEKEWERPTDATIMAFQKELSDQTAATQPLVSTLRPMDFLMEEYEGADSQFQLKIQDLQKRHFTAYRACRGDGNCWFRAISFAWLEHWHTIFTGDNPSVENEKWLTALTDEWKTLLMAGGYQWDTVDFFYEPLSLLLRALPTLTRDALVERFNDEETSNGTIVLFRLLCSAYMKAHPDHFAPFLEDQFMDLSDFCQREVDAFGVESGELQIIATVNALHLPCSIAYLDRSRGEGINFHDFSPMEDQPPHQGEKPVLLYRPGHYDIVYRQSEEKG